MPSQSTGTRTLARSAPETVWSHLQRSLANLAKRNLSQLTALVKTRLKRMQCRPGVLDGSSPAPASTSHLSSGLAAGTTRRRPPDVFRFGFAAELPAGTQTLIRLSATRITIPGSRQPTPEQGDMCLM